MWFQPSLWEYQGNVPPLTYLIEAYIKKDPTFVTTNNNLNFALGIFQKLIASRNNNYLAFELLQTIFINIEMYLIN